MLRIIALIPTDLPDPVVPAISKCGIRAKSAITGTPPMSLPSAKASFPGWLAHSLLASSSLRKTVSRFAFGTLDPDHVRARRG